MDLYEAAGKMNRLSARVQNIGAAVGHKAVELMAEASANRAEYYLKTSGESDLALSDWTPGISDLILTGIYITPEVVRESAKACREFISKIGSVARPPA